MSDNNTTEAEVVGEIACAAAAPHVTADGAQYTAIPGTWGVQSLEHLGLRPRRPKGNVPTADFESFVRYYNDHATPGQSNVYGDFQRARFLGILNDHGLAGAEAGWRDHTVTYDCELSRQWKTWTERNGRLTSQADFADFIEDNLLDIVEPAGNVMLEVSRNLQAKKKVNFAQAIRLANGTQEFTYQEEMEGTTTTTKGKVQIPETFVLGLPVLQGGTVYRVEAALRYRINEGALVIGYKILRLEAVFEDAVKEVWDAISQGIDADIYSVSDSKFLNSRK